MSLVSSVTPFLFDGETLVRVILHQDEPWFVAADVCAVLEHCDPSKAVSRLDHDERGTNIVRTPSGDQRMLVINESGLYSLILTSRKPAARRFKKWVTSEVLPTIRRTGSYGAAPLTEPPTRDFPDWPPEELRVRKATADLYRRVYGPLAAQWIMPRLGFPVPPRTLIAVGRQADLFEIIMVGMGR